MVSHQKQYEQVKLHEKCHHAKIDIYHMYGSPDLAPSETTNELTPMYGV